MMNRVIMLWLVGVSALFGLWTPQSAWSQTPGEAAFANEVPFAGIVVQDKLPMRAGWGRSRYIVGELKRGDLVEVREVFEGWLRIACPENCYSYISEAFVDAKGDGRSGVVNADRTPVKAGSINGPSDSYRTQLVLDQGHVVRIVEEVGSFYKIVPPQAASVWIAPDSVRRVSVPEESATRKPPVVEVEPIAVKPAESVTPIQAAATQPVIETPVAHNPPASQPTRQGVATEQPEPKVLTLRQLDEQLLPLRAKPLVEQPIDQLLELYRGFLTDPNLSEEDLQLVAARLAILQRNQQVLALLKRIDEGRKHAQQQSSPNAIPQGPAYDAVGTLRASSLYDGRNLPRMYRLVAPGGNRTIAYIQPHDRSDLRQALGKLVGVVGVKSYDSALKLQLIKVESIDPLGASD